MVRPGTRSTRIRCPVAAIVTLCFAAPAWDTERLRAACLNAVAPPDPAVHFSPRRPSSRHDLWIRECAQQLTRFFPHQGRVVGSEAWVGGSSTGRNLACATPDPRTVGLFVDRPRKGEVGPVRVTAADFPYRCNVHANSPEAMSGVGAGTPAPTPDMTISTVPSSTTPASHRK